MLILQRKEGESLLIGDEIEISILSVEAGRVRLAIEAPKSISILRSELKRLLRSTARPPTRRSPPWPCWACSRSAAWERTGTNTRNRDETACTMYRRFCLSKNLSVFRQAEANWDQWSQFVACA